MFNCRCIEINKRYPPLHYRRSEATSNVLIHILALLRRVIFCSTAVSCCNSIALGLSFLTSVSCVCNIPSWSFVFANSE